MIDLVSGEASESDEDVVAVGTDIYAITNDSDEDALEYNVVDKTDVTYTNNLLQRKLVANNEAIWRGITNIIKSSVLAASKQLLNTDQLLMKTQMTMQTVLTSLDLAQRNICQVHEKTSYALTENFIPDINLNQA